MAGTDNVLHMWTIFRDPLDFPGKYVVRRLTVARGAAPTPAAETDYVGDSHDAAREAIPPGLTVLPPSPGDHPTIVETWL